MRRGEALGLRWSDVDLDAGLASIRQTVILVNHATQYGTPKTKSGARSVDLDPGTVAAIRSHRKRQNEDRLLMGAGWSDSDLVFYKVNGDPLNPDRFSREFTRRVDRYGLPKLSLHGLRHTWATLALRTGIHPKVVQERLGHSNISITMDTLGLRFGEATALRVGRVEFLRRTITVAEMLSEVRGHLIFGEPKTRMSRRTVIVPTSVVEMLANHLTAVSERSHEDLIFTTPSGAPIRRNHFRRREWQPAVARAGLEGLTFHGLRL